MYTMDQRSRQTWPLQLLLEMQLEEPHGWQFTMEEVSMKAYWLKEIQLFIVNKGVGIGEAINCGFGMLLDGSVEAQEKAVNILFWDVSINF